MTIKSSKMLIFFKVIFGMVMYCISIITFALIALGIKEIVIH